MIAIANRDPEQFPEPNALRLDRRCNHHLAFGFGTHSCVGSAIIRALSKIALNALLERCKGPILLTVLRGPHSQSDHWLRFI